MEIHKYFLVLLIFLTMPVITMNYGKKGRLLTFIFLFLCTFFMFLSFFNITDVLFNLDFSKLDHFPKQIMLSFSVFNLFLFLFQSKNLSSTSTKNMLAYFFLFVGSFFFLKAENFFIYVLCFQFLNLTLFFPYISFGNEKTPKELLNYFILTIFVFCLFILGISFFVGATSTLNFYNFEVINQSLFVLSVSFFIFVTCFKLGVFPFHNWLPPLYSGFNSKNIFSYFFIEKVVFGWSLISILQSLIMKLGPNLRDLVLTCLTILSLLTSFYGILVAMMQTKIKKIISYHTISHSGFLLFFACLPFEQKMNQQFLFYLIFYSLSLTFTYLLLGFGNEKRVIDDVDDLTYLFQDNPKHAIGLFVSFILLFSTTLTLGFVFNFQIFINSFKEGFMFEIVTLLGLNFLGTGFLLNRVLVIFKKRLKVKDKIAFSN